MTARITLILTILLSTAQLPFCRCSVTNGENTSELATQAEACSHCRNHESSSRPCPARPDCCCRTSQLLMLADIQDSEFARDSQPTGSDVFFGDSRCSFQINSQEDAVLAAGTQIDSRGRALLMRTCRLLI